MAGSLENTVALVSGGGTGIGRGIALAFAREGAAVVVSGRRAEPLQSVVDEIKSAGGRAGAITGDVSSAADCEKVIRTCVSTFGSLNVLVNNAGIARMSALDATSERDIEQMININLLGTILLSRAAIPELLKHKETQRASILNIGTGAAITAVKNMSVYAGAKAGMIHFSRCLALELAEQKVRVNVINPGIVETPIFETMMPAKFVKSAMSNFASMTPLGRVGQPADIAEAAVFLSSSKAVWITGAELTIDGGLSVA